MSSIFTFYYSGCLPYTKRKTTPKYAKLSAAVAAVPISSAAIKRCDIQGTIKCKIPCIRSTSLYLFVIVIKRRIFNLICKFQSCHIPNRVEYSEPTSTVNKQITNYYPLDASYFYFGKIFRPYRDLNRKRGGAFKPRCND